MVLCHLPLPFNVCSFDFLFDSNELLVSFRYSSLSRFVWSLADGLLV